MAAKIPTALKLKGASGKKADGMKAVPVPAPKKSVKTSAPAAGPLETKLAKAASGAKSGAKPEKPRKPKLVRDSFTIPKSEYAALDVLKQRAATLGAPCRKSEVLRGGILALLAMSDEAFRHVMASVPTLKTGRPSKT